MKDNIKFKKAFSLIELSIVILIIGLIVAGIIGGKKLVTLSNLSKARALTNSSPVAGIENLVAWYETTSKNSFTTNPIDGDVVSNFNDINPQKTIKNNLVAGDAPVYTENAINGLPALKFNGSTNYLQNLNTQIVNGSGLSVFFVIKRISQINSSGILAMWKNGQTLDYNNPNSIIFQDDDTATNNFKIFKCFGCGAPNQMYQATSGNNNPLILSSIFTATNNNSYYNGSNSSFAAFQAQPVTSTNIFNLQNIRIGARQSSGPALFWNGYIGEIIIYDRALSDFEKEQIEQYLSKKWGIKLT